MNPFLILPGRLDIVSAIGATNLSSSRLLTASTRVAQLRLVDHKQRRRSADLLGTHQSKRRLCTAD